MNGKEMVKIIDSILAERGMTQKEFCEMIGVQSSTMTGWRNGSTPTPRRIAAIEKCLGISFSDYEKSDLREELREDLKTHHHGVHWHPFQVRKPPWRVGR